MWSGTVPELIPAAPGSPEWLAARRAGVTATDIVTILGLSSWSSAYSLFWQKMGQVPETPDNDRFRLGRELERYVVARWSEEHPEFFIDSGGHLYRNSERTWQMATLDRGIVTLPASEATLSLLECKTWADADRHSWQDGPPPAVRAQVLWQMDVMDVATGHVGVVFLPSGEFRSYTIEHGGTYDVEIGTHGDFDELQACSICADLDLMRAAGEEFMARLRLELPAPDPDASAATLAAVRARFARQPDKTAEVEAGLWERYESAALMARAHEHLKRGFEIQLREQAGEASVYTVDGQPVARRIVGDSPVKAHVRHSDYLRRINLNGASDE